MSITLQSIDPISVIPNNNPGNTPDYTEHEYISLRRYNGQPINHTQGDDNLELLRKKLNSVIQNININNQNLININNEVQDIAITQEFIDNIIQEILLDDSFWNNVNQRVTQYLIDDSTFNQHIDGRVIKFFEGDISQYINNQITEVITGLPPGFLEALFKVLDERFVDWNTFNNLSAKVDQIYNTIHQTIQTILGPYIVEINTFDNRLTVIEKLIDELLDFHNNGDPIDLTAIINAINQLGEDIGVNANNIAILDANLTTALTNISILTSTVGTLNTALAELAAIVDGIVDYIDGALADLLKKVKELFDDIANMVGILTAQVVQNSLNIDWLLDTMQWLNQQMALRFQEVWDEFFAVWNAITALEDKTCLLEAQMKAVMDFLDLLVVKEVQVCKDGVVDTEHFLTLDNGVEDFQDILGVRDFVLDEIVMEGGRAFQVNDAAAVNANPVSPINGDEVTEGWTEVAVPDPEDWAAQVAGIAGNAQNCINALRPAAGQGAQAQNAQNNANNIQQVLNQRVAAARAQINARVAAQQQGLQARVNRIQAGAANI